MAEREDHWSAEAYQNAAGFVPKLATKVVGWLDVKGDDVVLDVGCGDGILTHEIASSLSSGSILGIDSSPSMISTALSSLPSSSPASFRVLDALDLSALSTPNGSATLYTKIFSNAALHWILAAEATRRQFFVDVRRLLAPGGTFVFEMGGMGNVAEVRAAMYAVLGPRVGREKVADVDPWFFPDEAWIREVLEGERGWVMEKCELEYRPTKVDKGGVEGWLRLMCKQFFDVISDAEEREKCLGEVTEILKRVCATPAGEHFLGYVRLRVSARKVSRNGEKE